MNSLPDQPGQLYDAQLAPQNLAGQPPQPPHMEHPWRLQQVQQQVQQPATQSTSMEAPHEQRNGPPGQPHTADRGASSSTQRASAHAPLSCMERLRRRWESVQSLICVGLDPDLERIPPSVYGPDTGLLSLEEERAGVYVEGAIVAFNQAIVDATADLVCAFKPNSAFYEQYGP
ncbi:MAG: hypothetical protein ABI068_13240, partial [Ktedonobacterales bacterium]